MIDEPAPAVRRVRSRRDRRDVLALTTRPYAGNAAFVAPDTRAFRKLVAGGGLLRRRSALGRRAEHATFVARARRQAAARLSVFLHPGFEEALGKKIATIGFLEAMPGAE